MGKILTKEDIIERARQVHGDKYDYSLFLDEKFEYKNYYAKMPIICHEKDKNGNEHGVFWQQIRHHLNGSGCQICSKRKCSLTTDDFILSGENIHNNKYDYSAIEKGKALKNTAKEKLPIICHEHGVFYQSYVNHIKKKHGCPICGGSKLKTTEEFKNEALKVWGDTYILDKCEYKNSKEKIIVTCRKHGDFKVTPSDFLSNKNGCPECKFDKLRKTKDDFIKESEEIFGKGTIIYDEVKYVNNQTKVALICPIHGRFWKSPNLHLSQRQGCPICALENKIRSKLEEEIKKFLDDKGIHYIKEFRTEWLGKLTLDFYLPDYNVAIECQGEQHFQASKSKKSYFDNKNVNTIKERDKRKLKLCVENNVNLLYYSNLGIEYPYEVFEDKEILLKNILNKKNNE